MGSSGTYGTSETVTRTGGTTGVSSSTTSGTTYTSSSGTTSGATYTSSSGRTYGNYGATGGSSSPGGLPGYQSYYAKKDKWCDWIRWFIHVWLILILNYQYICL